LGTPALLIVTTTGSIYFFGVLTPSSSTNAGHDIIGLTLNDPFFTTLIFIVVS
jgi:hypothetical protein